jgi:hypothetical protein
VEEDDIGEVYLIFTDDLSLDSSNNSAEANLNTHVFLQFNKETSVVLRTHTQSDIA